MCFSPLSVYSLFSYRRQVTLDYSGEGWKCKNSILILTSLMSGFCFVLLLMLNKMDLKKQNKTNLVTGVVPAEDSESGDRFHSAALCSTLLCEKRMLSSDHFPAISPDVFLL